ncbi:MAG: hypothetical protein JKY53_09550 [Flavobacteriales bacterium]|nr:hypothetical protein [Flavobacteriales bacterium]
MSKYKFISLLFILIFVKVALPQPSIPNTTVIIKENRHFSSPSTSKNYETKHKSFYRNVQFDVLLGSSCVYDVGSDDQLDWSKFLKLTTTQCPIQQMNNVRLG